MHENKIEGCVAISVNAFSHDGKKLLSLTDGRNRLRRKEPNLCIVVWNISTKHEQCRLIGIWAAFYGLDLALTI